MHRATVWIGCSLVLTCLAGCGQSGAAPKRGLVLLGSRSMTPLVAEMGERFQERRPDVRINVQGASEGRAVGDTRQGLADLGMLGRPLRATEIGLLDFPIARDGLALIVHKDNPVPALSDGQIVGLFTGMYPNWKDLGGPDRPVALAGQAEGRAARAAFLGYFGLQPQQVRSDHTVSGSEQVIQAVAAHPYAIGYASLGEAEKAAQTLPIRLLPLGGVVATFDNVRNGRYPLVRPLLLLSRAPPQGAERDFIDFARSAEVHDLIGKYGFVPASTPPVPKPGAGPP